MIFITITTVKTIEPAPNTAIAKGIPKNPLLEKVAAKRIMPRVFSTRSFAVKGFDAKNTASVYATPIAATISSVAI